MMSLMSEEFVQSYLQYRWLDETRSKLVDRFFVLVLAGFGGWLQYANQVTVQRDPFMIAYFLFTVVLLFLAGAIVRFRRQQSGHGYFIEGVRNIIMARIYGGLSRKPNPTAEEAFHEYDQYRAGRKVRLTTGVDFAICFIAAVVSGGFLFNALKAIHSVDVCARMLAVVMALLVLGFLLIPWWRYNFKTELDWKRD